MNTKIALSGVSILAGLAMMAGATFAFFSDFGDSTGNVFASGTLNLTVNDAESVTATFGGTLGPNTCLSPQLVTLKNAGTVNANHVQMTVQTNTVNDLGNDANPDIDQFMRIQQVIYDGVPQDINAQIPDANLNGFRDLADWAVDADGVDDMALTDLNGAGHSLQLQVCLDQSAGNTLQGDSVTTTFRFLLNQDATQD